MSMEHLLFRMTANQNSKYNFDEWSINIMPKLPMKHLDVLDLGCGIGKQVNLFANFFPSNSNIYALDISRTCLGFLQDKYPSQKYFPSLHLIHDDFDNFYFRMEGPFHLIYSFYSLYYSNNLYVVIERIFDSLYSDTTFWVVGPYLGTNSNILDIVSKFYDIDSFEKRVLYSINYFHRDVINIASEVGFSDLKINLLKNSIYYKNPESLMGYIRNTKFFNSAYDMQIKEEIYKMFATQDIVWVPKNVISMQFGV